MTSKRALRGIAAAGIGAGVALTALFGVEIGAFASTDPKPPSCAVAIQAWQKAEASQKDASKARDAAKDESTAAHVELSNAKALKDDDKPATDETGKKYKVAQAEARVKAADKDLDAKDKALVNAKGRNANRKAEADLACQGPAGQPGAPGQDGKPGAPAPAPAPAAPSTVIVQPAPVQQAPVVIQQAPAPTVQDSGPVVTH